jgi:hypothetical protein
MASGPAPYARKVRTPPTTLGSVAAISRVT